MIYAFNVPMVADDLELTKRTVISTNEGIQIGVKPSKDAPDFVERENTETGDLLWCEANAYYNDDPELLSFLEGEGVDISGGNPFTETT